ncbi:MAG: hypothetical protein O9327_02490 [Polaromonas sp.]|nr:hypothetical protein [Polaromonas sp.]
MSTTEADSAAMLGTWEVHPSVRGTFMVIEEDGTDDGRLIADKMRESDARRIVALHNAAVGSRGLQERLQSEAESRRKWQGPHDELAGLLDEARIAIVTGGCAP